ncbi:NAD-dependent epimerase [Spirochaetia bacterium]|nr:NAD-dependent epimerase [Spirochaetia bacterium]
MKLLVTGTAGFIGYHLSRRLAEDGHTVVGIDNINDYYDVDLKYGRLAELEKYPNMQFIKMDITNVAAIKELLATEHFDIVLHLAAQAGVRYSLKNPDAYISSNIQGFLNMLEAVRITPVRHFVYASSSSVYGLNTTQPFIETQDCSSPASLYAASKRTNELLAHTYAHLYGIPVTGLRFFTVYGPWGRPDMAPMLFTKSILEGKPITVFNNGNMQRDFTYVGDIVEGIVRLMKHIPMAVTTAPTHIYNIGNGTPVALLDFIHTLENALGCKAKIEYAPMQAGDVPVTWADCSALEQDTGYRPVTTLAEGIKQFIVWYKNFYRE